MLGIGERRDASHAPTVGLSLTEPAQAALPSAEEQHRVRETRYADGALAMAIDDLGPRGFRIAAPAFGEHHVSADGTAVRSTPAEGLEPWRWQRLLIGQVLPLVSAINGLEVLHASAIATSGRAFALAGDAGAGKSTLAALLALNNHELLADDLLAVSLDAGEIVAHPGSTSMSFRPTEASLAHELERSAIARTVGRDDKTHVRLDAAVRPLPLRAIYWLRRADGPILERARSATVADLMSLTYVKYLRTAQRLTRQLELQAALAREVAFIPVNVAPGVTPTRLRSELEGHMRRLAAG